MDTNVTLKSIFASSKNDLLQELTGLSLPKDSHLIQTIVADYLNSLFESEGAYRQHYRKHHRNNNIDFSAHFLLPFHIVSLRWSQISAILRIPQLDTLHEIRSISTTEQFLRCIEIFPAFFRKSIPEIKGKVADLDCATGLPTAMHTFRYDTVPLEIKHLSDIHSRFF